MKNIWKHLFVGLLVSCLYVVCAASIFPALFSIWLYEESLVIGTGMFLSCEMVVLTSMMLSKLKDKD